MADDPASELRRNIRAAHRMDEALADAGVLAAAELPGDVRAAISARAGALVRALRDRGPGAGLDSFLREYDLSTREGVALMCLAEALLRIPDPATADRLIRDKIASGHWDEHLGRSGSLFVNASTWGLMLTGRLLGNGGAADAKDWKGLAARAGEPLLREATLAAMRILGHQFVLGRDIGEALNNSMAEGRKGYRHSFDMLGEAALTREDAERHFHRYAEAIIAIGAVSPGLGPVEAPGVSVKLSALHPRYRESRREQVMTELVLKVVELCRLAARADIGLCIDAEEADRLELSLDLLEAVSGHPSLKGWNGLGLAVQAYQKRAMAEIDWLADLAGRHRRRLQIRLVKGAYWDAEIKQAQVGGFAGYPVFTRKQASDVSYIACTKKILAAGNRFFPAFASHNAHTVAMVAELAGPGADMEFQRLHGMGRELFSLVAEEGGFGFPCRIYAPVGEHGDLLPYLVRRLLENGSNSSFVNRLVDAEAPVESLIADPAARLEAFAAKPHPRIPLPARLFGDERANSRGFDLDDRKERASLEACIGKMAAMPLFAAPIIGGEEAKGKARDIFCPFDIDHRLGTCIQAGAEDVERAFALARPAQPEWDGIGGHGRADILERAADLFEENRLQLMALVVLEAGKTMADAVAELREAVDFLRYYAARARADFASSQLLGGPTGERDEIRLAGRGVFVCVSPWNFPLAIFTGQVAAALAAGNAVLAKPAGLTPLIAHQAVRLLLEAGLPPGLIHLLPGPGEELGEAMIGHPGLSGVAFTGSLETALWINRRLAARPGPILPLIAETGGQNAMIVDSSALPEQVVHDAMASAFQSAGQRCSALRVLLLQDEAADRIMRSLEGAMRELKVGDPTRYETDVGPLINAGAVRNMEEHIQHLQGKARLKAAAPMDEALAGRGHFFTPRLLEIKDMSLLDREVFGPILHVLRYSAQGLDKVVEAVNATGFGLTLGIHSRINSTIERIVGRARVGNIYVNRNQIGAVVGVQPFGGEGLSGTGPKAGGPRYLHRFAVERTLSADTTASGGNASLLVLGEEDG